MMLLLDTHALLWWLSDDPQLPGRARELIADSQNTVFVSAVNAWEITVKKALGKLEIPEDWADRVAAQPFRRIPVTWEHAVTVGTLTDLHRDPFDRLLVAQALVEQLVLVTQDSRIVQYGVPVVWA